VPERFADAVLDHVSLLIRAILEVMRVSGMRPGEACQVRACDLDMSGPVWVYTPASHESEHHGRGRQIYIGPQGQAIIRPWLVPDVTAYLFSPARFMEEHWQSLRRPGGHKPKPRATPPRRYGERYSPDSVELAVRKACKEAHVPHWNPYQLIHNISRRL
jgi:integrase